MAIAAFVLGLLSASLLAIIFGIVALKRIRRTHQGGKGLAIAGITLGCAWLALIIALVAVGVIRGPTAATPGVATSLAPGASSQTVDPWTLSVGDCFDLPATTGDIPHLAAVVQTACTQPHNAQVFAKFNLSGSLFSYPGDAKVRSLGSSGCEARARASLDSSKVTDSVTIRFLRPTEAGWLTGKRTISCHVYTPTPTLTVSLLKSNVRAAAAAPQRPDRTRNLWSMVLVPANFYASRASPRHGH